MKKLVFLLLFAGIAQATEVTIQVRVPTINCEGGPVDASTLGQFEIYISEVPIETGPADCTTPSEPPPSGFTPITVPAGDTSIAVDLEPGTYFIRSRIVGNGGLWSNLSPQITHTVGPIQVRPPTVIIVG